MKNKQTLVIAALVLFANLQTLAANPNSQAAQQKAQGQSPSTARLIGSIKNYKIVEGCGCYFQIPSESRKASSNQYIFWSDLDEKEALMNIEGKDIRLRLARSKDSPGKERKGSRSSRAYKATDIALQIDRVAANVCAPNDESCEFTGYDAVITITKQGSKQIIKARGGCGC